MKNYRVLVGYNRLEDIDRDYHKIINVKANNVIEAIELTNSYKIIGMFDNIENDYIEDSLFTIKALLTDWGNKNLIL